MEKERIFDRRKNLKLKVHDAVILTYLCLLLPRQLREFSQESQSVAFINGHKSSKSRRATNRPPRHRIARCDIQATCANDIDPE